MSEEEKAQQQSGENTHSDPQAGPVKSEKASKAKKKQMHQEAKPVMTDSFKYAMQEINTALAVNMGMLDIVKVKKQVFTGEHEEFRDGYSWAQQSESAIEGREHIREVLSDAWQSGALNYDMIAAAVRLPVLSIFGLIDEGFIEANGL